MTGTPPAFPNLSGQGWSVHKRPKWSTTVSQHVSGREVRAQAYQYPLWEFEATFDGLTDSATLYSGLGAQSMQTLAGFYLSLQGAASPFIYADPSDNYVTVSQTQAYGDGSTENFTLGRLLGGFREPVGWVTTLTAVAINGVNQSGATWGLTTPNTLTFETAPTSGLPISATFNYAFYCRMSEDNVDFEEFMQSLWQLQSFKFKSIRNGY